MDADGYFDESVAATYDEDSAERFDPAAVEPAVDFLAELADAGSALEFAIATGRIAVRSRPVAMPFRYVWPSELDLMAQLAGMTLRERWAGWTKEPFTNESRSHVSVWEKPAD